MHQPHCCCPSDLACKSSEDKSSSSLTQNQAVGGRKSCRKDDTRTGRGQQRGPRTQHWTDTWQSSSTFLTLNFVMQRICKLLRLIRFNIVKNICRWNPVLTENYSKKGLCFTGVLIQSSKSIFLWLSAQRAYVPCPKTNCLVCLHEDPYHDSSFIHLLIF